MARVCKQWHCLALPYLYEWILASKLKNLEGIVRAVERPLSSDSSTHVGWFTRRLDIDIRLTGGETREQKKQEGGLTLRLLRAVPNLQVLTVGTCYHDCWMSPSLSHTYCLKLEFFNWMSERDIFKRQTWIHFVQSHPNLIALHPCAIEFPSSKTIIPKIPPHSLRTLTTAFTSAVAISPTFTSLERLSLNLYNMFGAWDHFFEQQITGPIPSLTALQLNFNITHHIRDLRPEFLGLQRLFQFLPNLYRIDLVLPIWPEIWSETVLPPGVSVLGFRVCSGNPSRFLVRWLLRTFNKIVQSAQSPLKVQFLDEKTMEGVCIHEEYVVQYAKAEKVLESWLDPDGNIYKLCI